MRKSIAYIAGKMTGLPDKGRAAFADAEEKMTQLGYVALNPAAMPDGMPAYKYMPICLAMIDQADMVVLLDGWEDSPGANVEKAYAAYQGKTVLQYRAIMEAAERQ